MFASAEAVCPHSPQLISLHMPGGMRCSGLGWLMVLGAPAHAAEEATVLRTSSGVGAQGNILRVCVSIQLPGG